ncbi:MAG: SH3 domain-containing protein [Spirochaetota bacterium]
MKKVQSTIRSLIFITVICSGGLAAQETERTVVTAAVLRLRSEPAATAAVVATVKRGTIVKILGKSDAQVTIDNISDYWYRVESDGKGGWLFGGYTDTDFKVAGTNSNILLWQARTGGEARNLIAYDISAQKERKFATLPEAVGCDVSADLQYLVCDAGTDSVGMLTVFDFQTTRKIHEGPYQPRGFTWKGDSLYFDHVLCVDDGFTIKEEMIVKAGKVKKTGIYRRGGYHVGVTSGDCAKYKKLAK